MRLINNVHKNSMEIYHGFMDKESMDF